MASPETATSHTKRLSYALYPSSPVSDNTVSFYFRRGDVKQFDMITLPDLQSARAVIDATLNSLSTSPTRVVLLNDDAKVDMPEVDLDGLERIVKQDTLLGQGSAKQIFVIVYDRDPTAEPEWRMEEAARASLRVPVERKGRVWPGISCCVVL